MDRWQPVEEDEKQGIVIHYFESDAPYRLRLTLGEKVVILQKNGDWYLGHTSTKINHIGIFPKSFICCKTSNPKVGITDRGDLDFIQEVTSSIREWGKIWKKIYMEHDTSFLKIRMMIEDLIFFRSKMLSGLLSKHYLLEVKQTLISLMDDGNKLLGMDIVARDENGDTLDPKSTPIMKLFKKHLKLIERTEKSINGFFRDGVIEMSSYFHSFYVSIEEYDLNIEEEMEFILFLYDAKEEVSVTENFVYLFKRDELLSGNEKTKPRVLFKDLVPEDMRREQLYLVCHLIKTGKSEKNEFENNNSLDTSDETRRNGPFKKGKRSKRRRPFGVAAAELSPYLSETGEHNEIPLFLPLALFDGNDLATTLRKMMHQRCNEKKQYSNEGLRIIAKVLPGEINEAIRKNRHLKLETLISARKIGIPKVVFPSYVRNEIYLTLVEGEFYKTAFTPNRNIEVAVCLCDGNGAQISEMIYYGAGVKPVKEYHSVIYFHNMKPKWMETIKINFSSTVLKGLHLKFTFTHRALSNTLEKPFALSYLNILQSNGALLFDGRYSLVVYKVDQNKWKDEDHMYLYLPSKTSEVSGGVIKGFSANKKDKFVIKILSCSTKLTQNIHLVWLLDWKNNLDILNESLTALLNLNGWEIVKFLPDVLDALFQIITEDVYYETHRNLLFSCLVYIFDLVSDEKYALVQNVLESYIKKSFCSPTVFGKLIFLLNNYFKNISYSKKDCLLKLVRSMKFFMKCIVRSKHLYNKLSNGHQDIEFETSMKNLLSKISESLCSCKELDLNIKRNIFNHLYPVYSEILDSFKDMFKDATIDFCLRIAKLIKEHDILFERSAILITLDMIHSKMFFLPENRTVLMPVLFDYIIQNLQNLVEVELGVNCLMELLDLNFELGIESSIECNTMISIIQTLVYSIIHVEDFKVVGEMVTLMIALLGRKQFDFFQQCTHHFSDDNLMLVFLMEMLIFFEELVSRPVYPSEWCDMLLLQNSVILKTIKSISTIIGRKFLNPFQFQIWSNFFHSSAAFVTQPCLQLETHSEKKRMHILTNFKDMRKEMTHEIKNMWFTLGTWKKKFIPDLVGPFLELGVIPDEDIKNTIVPIFFDMAQCEFFCYEPQENEFHASNRQKAFEFPKFEKEFIEGMNKLLEGGKGKIGHMNQFYDSLGKSFEEDSSIKIEGYKFITSVKCQLKWLDLYRKYIQDNDKENAIICAYELLNFYQQVNNVELYVRYVCKLLNLHLECENFTEAAYSLDLLRNLLNWSDEPTPLFLITNIYHDCRTNYTFKEAIYKDIITYLDKGKMWNSALSYCKELGNIYEYEVHDYEKLSNILKKMAIFYDNIMQKTVPESEYYCISYKGKEFPSFLQNKTFIYRWLLTDEQRDFTSYIKRNFPKANLIYAAPGSQIDEPAFQNIYLHQVYPVFNNEKYRNLSIHGQILWHLQESDLKNFYCSAPLTTHDQSECQNPLLKLYSFRTLYSTSVVFPGILVQALVVSTESCEINPIESMIVEIQRNNMSFHSVLSLRNQASSNINHICNKLKKIAEGSIVNVFNSELKSLLMDIREHEDFRNIMQLLKEQKALIYFFLHFLGENFPESLKLYMKKLDSIINKFSFDTYKGTSTDTMLHFPYSIREKSVKDARNTEISWKSGQKIIDGFKRKASLTRKMILSRRSSESQGGSSQWYIPSPTVSNYSSSSTLPAMNLSDEVQRDSTSYVQPSVAAISLSQISLQDLRDSPLSIHQKYISKSKVEESISLPGQLGDYLRFEHHSDISDEDDCLSFVTSGSHTNILFPLKSVNGSQNLAIMNEFGDENINASPPPLPLKRRDSIKISGYLDSKTSNRNAYPHLSKEEKLIEARGELDPRIRLSGTSEEDRSSYESTKPWIEPQSISSSELGKLPIENPDEDIEENNHPPVPPRKKRLLQK